MTLVTARKTYALSSGSKPYQHYRAGVKGGGLAVDECPATLYLSIYISREQRNIVLHVQAVCMQDLGIL